MSAETSSPEDRLAEINRELISSKKFAEAKAALQALLQSDDLEEMVKQKITWKLAVATYKNPEQAPAERFREALNQLGEIGLGSDKVHPETMRLGGAIYKRKWEFEGQLEDLNLAYTLYRSAAQKDRKDNGYGAVNAAFLLDLMAENARINARRAGTDEKEADVKAKEAVKLRQNTLTKMAKIDQSKMSEEEAIWLNPTLAELHFGLGKTDEAHFDQARGYLQKSVDAGLQGWELETSFTQLVKTAKAQQFELPEDLTRPETWQPVWQALMPFVASQGPYVLESFRGKVGLALSGGGFRASFYHIGVLARLAEMNVLSSVEVISTVSGGSIVGALYYLEVKYLLEHKADSDITAQDYVDIVNRISYRFFNGVSKNLRMRTFMDLISNLRMLGDEKYSRSHRIGRLYEELLYDKVGWGTERETKTLRNMSDLKIRPCEDPAGDQFNPKADNWRRRSRVPVLLLNTTSLNSGHNWRFTATWMGEPPVAGNEIDRNARYAWNYYDPKKGVPEIPLGNAVAASACVPGLFEPLEIAGLYGDDHTVKLVDGGVHDNQGVAGLIDEGCTLMLVSDASGQMDDISMPDSNPVSVPLRSNSILMDRVREAQYQDLVERVENGALEGLFFTHLKDGLQVPQIAVNAAKTPMRQATLTEPTGYHIHPEIQRRIAALRTDLDCFSEVEANALMLSGYKMTEWHFKRLQKRHKRNRESGTWGNYDVTAKAQPKKWTFLDERLQKVMNQAPAASAESKELAHQLEVGASLFFKVFRVDKKIRWIGFGVAAIVALAVVTLLIINRDSWVNITLFDILSVVFGAAISWLIVWAFGSIPTFKMLNVSSFIKRKVREFFVGLGGALLSWIQVKFLDPHFLENGKLQRLFSQIEK